MKHFGEGALRCAAIAGAVLPSLLIAEPSHAASRTCRALEAELAGGGGGGNSAQFRRYDRAATAQRQQLSNARARARSAGCGFAFLSPQMCRPLTDQIERMEGNLAALERRRDQLANAKPRRSRATILAALEANGCRDKTVAEHKPAREWRDETDGDLFKQLFGSGIQEGEALEARNGPASVTRILNPNGETMLLGGDDGQFSTMCVRTCDGYYFPISPNSSSADFDRDQKNCEATCPGTDVQLYYRPADTEDADTMMSTASGEAYASLPTAYVYRDATKPRQLACGCGGAAVNPNFSIVGGETDDVPSEPVIPAPSRRPDPAADPETLANAEGKLDVETIKRILKRKEAVAPLPPPGERKIRVVGPAFLPDPEGAINLKAPAQKGAQSVQP